jgi:phosphoglycolate phosphatase
MKTDGLIFDLDGTLWDASSACILAWNSALQQFGLDNTRVDQTLIAGFSGRLLEDILAEHFKIIPPEQYERFVKLYAAEEAIQMKTFGGILFPNAKIVLEKLALTYPLFIVSNCQKGYIENFLQQHDLEKFFKDFECSGNTGLPKSNNIHSLIRRNNLLKPIYIGDTQGDYEASKWNEIPFIYAGYGFGKPYRFDAKISQLSELTNLLAE